MLNDDVVRGLGVTPAQLREVAEREGRELERRESVYRSGRPPLQVAGKVVILVDDGLATGASMRAAVLALREDEPAQIVVAVPAIRARTGSGTAPDNRACCASTKCRPSAVRASRKPNLSGCHIASP